MWKILRVKSAGRGQEEGGTVWREAEYASAATGA